MGFKEYNEYDALGLAELVRKKAKAKHVFLKLGKEGLLINSLIKNNKKGYFI